MKRTALAAIGLAVLLVTAGLATAAPGATTTPADGPNEHANDAARTGADNADHADENATDDHEGADEPEAAAADESEQSDCTCSDDENETDADENETDADENETDVDENATQAREENAEQHRNEHAEENEARQGPPTEMPANVPDHVSEIHVLIQNYLDGDLSGSLGSAISDLVGETPEAGNQPADAGDEADEHGPEMTTTTESSA
ncbi:hypothetical protein ACFQH6_16270 [Halobacteriaceae archaeon GCM10025711]